jgi:hypothetical protein
VEEDLRVHSYPEILSLGIMLLQVYLGEPIEAKRPQDRQEVDPAIYGVDADRVPAHKMLQTCDDSLHSFNDVILKCLSPQTFIPLGRALQDETLRQEIYTEIVYPLEQILSTGYNINLEDEIALGSKLWSFPRPHDLPRNTPKSMSVKVSS